MICGSLVMSFARICAGDALPCTSVCANAGAFPFDDEAAAAALAAAAEADRAATATAASCSAEAGALIVAACGVFDERVTRRGTQRTTATERRGLLCKGKKRACDREKP
jgi:hypothetical protein